MKLIFERSQLPKGQGGVKYESRALTGDKPCTIYIPQRYFIEEGIPVRLAPRQIACTLDFKVDEAAVRAFFTQDVGAQS